MKLFIFAPVIEQRLQCIDITLNKLLAFLEKDQTEDEQLTKLTETLAQSEAALQSAMQNQQPTEKEK